jgi:hypothetical protein
LETNGILKNLSSVEYKNQYRTNDYQVLGQLEKCDWQFGVGGLKYNTQEGNVKGEVGRQKEHQVLPLSIEGHGLQREVQQQRVT